MNRTTVTKTTNTYGKNRRRSALPIVVLCLFVIFVIVGIGSSAWNIHLKLDSSSSATFVTGENANSQLSKYINNNTTESITIDGKSYPSFTYDKNEHSPTLQENLVESGETHARPLPTEWFDESYVLLAKPTASGNDWTFESAEQNLSSAPTDAGVYRYTVTPNEKAGEDAKYLGTASVDFVIVPRSVDVWILADESVYGDEHMPNVIAEGNNVFIGNDFDELKSAHTEISFKYIDSVSAASDADSLLTSLPKTAPAGDYEIIATDISLNYNITYSKGKKNADNTIVDATASDAVDYTINKRDISISFNLTNTLTKTYGEAVNKDLFYRQLVLKDAENNIVFEYKNGEFVNSIWNTESMSALDAIKSVIILDSEVTERSIVGTYDIVPTLINANYNALSGLDNKGKFEVTKLLAEIEWFGDFSFVYDGTTKVATARVMNLLFEDVCDVTVLGGAVNVGNYTATVSGLSNGNYAFNSNITHAFEITKAEISFEFDAVSFEYNKTEQKPTATNLSGIVTADSGKVSLSVTPRKQSINVDTYIADLALEGEKAGNYSISQTTVDYTITQKSLTVTWGNTNFTYNGNPQCPSVTLGGVVSNDDVSCVVTGAQTNAGNNYTARITGLSGTDANNYKLSDNADTEKSFSIAKASLNITANDVSTIYGDDAPTFSATMTGNVEGETLNVSFDCSYAKGSNAGSYDIVPKLSGENSNYNVSITNGTLTVEKRTVTLTWTNTTLTYNGSLQTPTLTLGNIYGEDSVSASVIEGGAKDVGESYTAIVKSLTNTNYKLPDNASVEFSIIPLVAVIEWIAPFSFEYDGNFHSPTARVSNLKGADKCDVIVSGSAKNVGESHTATAESLSNANYKLPESGSSQSFSITKRVLTITWKTSNLVYNGNNQHPSVTLGRVVNNEDVSCVISGAQINVGNNYTATITGLSGANKDNYQLPENGLSTDFSISQKLLTVTWGDTNFTYNGNPQCPSVTLGGVVANDDVSCVVTGAQTNAGNYTATVAGLSGTDKANYKLPDTGLEKSFSIAKANIDVSGLEWKCADEVLGEVQILNGNRVSFNGNTLTVSLSIPQDLQDKIGDILSLTFSGVLSSNSIGKYTASATFVLNDTNNYTLLGTTNYTFEWEVVAVILIYAPTLNTDYVNSLEYDATDKDLLNNAFTFNSLSYDNYENKSAISTVIKYKQDSSSSAIETTETKNAGIYVIEFTLINTDLYAWADGDTSATKISAEIIISQKTAELLWTNLTFIYDGNSKTPTITVTNVCSGDECFVLTTGYATKIGLELQSAPTNAGIYFAKVLTLSNSNYKIPTQIDFIQKQFTISEANIELPIINSVFIADGTESRGGVLYNRYAVLYNNSEIEFFTNSSEFSGYVSAFNNSASEVGEYEVILSISDMNNYTWKDNTKDSLNYLFVIANPVCHNLTKNTNHLTVEGALNDAVSGDILYLIPATKANYSTSNKVTPDKVEYTIREDCEIKSGVTLILPTDTVTLSSVTSSSTANYLKAMYEADKANTSKQHAYKSESNYLRCTLNIENDKTLTNNGTLIISGYLSAGDSNGGLLGQTAYSYAQIKLGSGSAIIQNNSNANLYCFGYIWENLENNSSKVELNSGKLHIPYVLDDYKGFSFSWAMTDGAIDKQKCSPFNQFEMMNIDALVLIKYGVKVTGYVNVLVTYSSLNVNEVFPKQLNMVGTTSSDFIQLSDSKFSYLEYKYNESTSIAQVNVYGGASLNPISLELSASGLTVDLSTTNAYFPISYHFDIGLYKAENQTNNAVYNFSNQRIKLLPGSVFSINENCELIGNELVVYSSFLDGSTGNGETSTNGYSAVYPQKTGAILKVLGNANVTFNVLAGTLYKNDNATLSYKTQSIVVKEAWSYGSSGKIKPAWTITDYLEIREQLQVLSIDDLSKAKLYVGLNTFTNYNTFLPAIDIIVDGVTYSIDTYQKVIVLDSSPNVYKINMVRNVFKAFYAKTYYTIDSTIAYSQANAIITAVNSRRSISSTPIDEFRVQSINIECTTPTDSSGNIPLYVDSTIQLKATVVDLEKIYNKTMTWRSSNTAIATVDNKGKVTGKALGAVTIYVICDGVEQFINLNVIEPATKIVPIEKITITDNNGNSSEKTTSGKYNGEYKNGTDITFTVNISPSDAQYAEIEWTFTASAVGRQYMDDNKIKTETKKGVTSVIIHIVSGSNWDDDDATLICKVTGLDGTVKSATFNVCHKADTCIVEGTLITLADGTQKKVEDLTIDDKLIVFNHETGKYDIASLLANIHYLEEATLETIIELEFSNGNNLRIVSEHAVFDKTLNKYVYINETNAPSFIGHSFVTSEYVNGQVISGIAILNNVKIKSEVVKYYNPASVWHINLIANGFLTSSAGMTNLFEYDETMRYDVELMQKDIDKYGFYTYDDFKEYMPEAVFNVFPFKYYKVAVGKGEFTFEKLLWLLDFYNSDTTIKPPAESVQSNSVSNSEQDHSQNENASQNPLATVVVPPSTTSSSGGSNGDGSNDDES